MDMNITSWSDQDLKALCDPKNHKIVYDGYDYWWHHKIQGNKWELHSVKGYANWKTHYSHIKYWLYKYAQELSNRRLEESNDILNDMMLHDRLLVIAKGNMKTKRKIQEILSISPEAEVTYIAALLNVSRQAIHRHL